MRLLPLVQRPVRHQTDLPLRSRSESTLLRYSLLGFTLASAHRPFRLGADRYIVRHAQYLDTSDPLSHWYIKGERRMTEKPVTYGDLGISMYFTKAIA